MKSILTLAIVMSSAVAFAQDFNRNLATAKNAYAGGNLEEARFAMQQMINDVDMAIGKELLSMLPSSLESRAANTASDNVTANTGFAGVLVHREYGPEDKYSSIDIMGNSPMIASINAILALPFMGNSGDQKVVKVDGYKAVLQKNVNSETNQTDYTLQVPLNSTLLTLSVPDSNEAEVLKMANTIPVRDIAKLVQ